MNCKRVRQIISLQEPLDHRSLQHLEQCSACRAVRIQQERLDTLLESWDLQTEPSSRLLASVRAGLGHEQAAARRDGLRWFLRQVQLPMAGARRGLAWGVSFCLVLIATTATVHHWQAVRQQRQAATAAGAVQELQALDQDSELLQTWDMLSSDGDAGSKTRQTYQATP